MAIDRVRCQVDKRWQAGGGGQRRYRQMHVDHCSTAIASLANGYPLAWYFLERETRIIQQTTQLHEQAMSYDPAFGSIP